MSLLGSPVLWAFLVPLAIHGLGVALLLGLARLARAAPAGRGPIPTIVGFGLGIWALGMVAFGLGLVGGLRPLPIGAVVLAAALYGLAHLPRMPARPWVAGWFEAVLVGSVLVLSLGHLLRSLAPPTAHDAIAYHLALGKLFAAAGGFVDVPTIRQGRWPLALDAHFAIAECLGGFRLSGFVAWLHGAYATLAVAGVGFVLAGRSGGLFAAALFAGTPAVAFLQGIAYVDAGLAGLVAASLVAGLAALQADDQGDSRRWLLAAGLVAGAAAGVKYTALVVPLLIGLVVAVAGAGSGAWSGRSWRRGALVLVVAGIAALPWYARTLALTGNPVWPYAYGWLGGAEWSVDHGARLGEFERGFGVALTARNLLALPFLVTFRAKLFDSLPLGPCYLALAPLLVGRLLVGRRLVGRRLPREVLCTLGFAVVGLATWPFLTQQVRFLVPVLPPLAAVLGWAVVALPRGPLGSLARGLIAVSTASSLVLVLPAVLDRLPVLAGGESTEAYLSTAIRGYPAMVFVNRTLRPQRLLLLGEVRGYYLDVPYLWGDPLNQALIDYANLNDGDALYRRLVELGVDGVLIDAEGPAAGALSRRSRQLIAAMVEGHGERVFDDGVVVYRLR